MLVSPRATYGMFLPELAGPAPASSSLTSWTPWHPTGEKMETQVMRMEPFVNVLTLFKSECVLQGGVMDRVVSQLLAEMDGLQQEGATPLGEQIVFVIGATNRPGEAWKGNFFYKYH